MKDMTLAYNAKLYEVVDSIINNKTRTIFLRNNENQIIGCLTEGDVLRAFVNGSHRNSDSHLFMNTNFLFYQERLSDLELAHVFLQFGVLALPILDQSRKLLEIQFPMEAIRRLLNTQQ